MLYRFISILHSWWPDIQAFGLFWAVLKYVIQNCEWFTLKTQMALAGLCFFLLPNNTQSKSPYTAVIFFVSASKRTKQHVSGASFDRFWDGLPGRAGQKGTAISERRQNASRGTWKRNKEQNFYSTNLPLNRCYLQVWSGFLSRICLGRD